VKKAIIIGAGIAGLATAARLAAGGWRVTVFERGEAPGGKLGILQQDGYTFDTGPSLFTQPWLLEDLFRDCGRSLSGYFTYRSLDEGTRYFWEDGSRLHAAPRKEDLAAAIAGMGADPAPVLCYLDDARDLYTHIGSLFLDAPIHQLSAWKTGRLGPALRHLRWPYLFQSLHTYNRNTLKDPRIVQVFDRMATYNGSDPYRCPAMLSMIAHLEFNEGSWYAGGGMISIPQALGRLCADLGVTFRFGTPVERILHTGGSVTGVMAGGLEERADVVVSNSDVYFTYRQLLGDDAMADRIRLGERSSSGTIFYWGIRHRFPELGLHNIFFSDHYREEFRTLFRSKTAFHDPTVYINITSVQEPQHAPEGGANWFVLVNSPAGKEASREAPAVRAAVLAKLSRLLGRDIAPLIQTESVMTQEDIESRTGSYEGALYGTASNSPMAAFRRHPNTARKYRGLYFAGGTVHPGGGIPLCLRSARITSGLIGQGTAS
jgi:phytoene desaturase